MPDPTPPRPGATPSLRRLGGALSAVLTLLAAPTASAQDAALARSLAATCANCHGTDGRAQMGELPALAGQSADRLLSTLADFRDGRRASTIMQQIVKGYREDQLRLIAGHFAGVRP